MKLNSCKHFFFVFCELTITFQTLFFQIKCVINKYVFDIFVVTSLENSVNPEGCKLFYYYQWSFNLWITWSNMIFGIQPRLLETSFVSPSHDRTWYSFFLFVFCYLHKTGKHDNIKDVQNIYYKYYVFVHRKYRQQFHLCSLQTPTALNRQHFRSKKYFARYWWRAGYRSSNGFLDSVSRSSTRNRWNGNLFGQTTCYFKFPPHFSSIVSITFDRIFLVNSRVHHFLTSVKKLKGSVDWVLQSFEQSVKAYD